MKNPNHLLKNLPLFLLISFTLSGCNATKNAPVSGTAVSLSKLAKKPALYAGKEIQLTGIYQGWKHDNCRFPETFSSLQITRSDWTISDGKRCCYVSGGIPDGLQSTPDQPVPILLTAKVRSKDSKVYLEYVSSQLTK